MSGKCERNGACEPGSACRNCDIAIEIEFRAVMRELEETGLPPFRPKQEMRFAWTIAPEFAVMFGNNVVIENCIQTDYDEGTTIKSIVAIGRGSFGFLSFLP